MPPDPIFPYLLHLADNALVLGQRNAEWTGHGPVLEQDIAITNIALDLVGQARNLYAHAATFFNGMEAGARETVDYLLPRPWKTFHRELEEDDLAFLRDEGQYLNLLLTELPRGDWAFTLLRQFFFSAYQKPLFLQLAVCEEAPLAAVAEKAVKEVSYHLRWSSEWVIRLGDGTGESRRRMHQALEELWPYTGEMFRQSFPEEGVRSAAISVDMEQLQAQWEQSVAAVFDAAGLEVPKEASLQQGGKEGRHTEHMGYLLAEMQYLQRTYPDAKW